MDKIVIGNKCISSTSPVFIIAEGGVNHNGSIDLAKKLVDEAKIAGVDCIKFQTYKTENIITKNAPKANYQLKVTDPQETQFEMLKKLELSLDEYRDLLEYCKASEILFLSTPYNNEDIDFLDDLGVEAFKVASGQLVEHSFIRHMARKMKPMILSTGMSFMADIDEAVRVIQSENNDKIILLQCTTNYPSLEEEANLLAIKAIQHATGCLVGYSDHTLNNICILGSVALGAKVIEKHFTLDKNLPGPDHGCSANPLELKNLVHEIRLMEKALGSPIKAPSIHETKNIKGMRRSLTARISIKKGQTITENLIGVKRPATGIEPKLFDKIIGQKAAVDIEQDTVLQMGMIEWQ
jgi:N-acetylneuraminate synthase/N,N'-diacetyllegionaminate synthase